MKFTYLGHKWSSVLGNVGSATTSVTICVSSLYHNKNIWMWECYDLFGKIRTLTDLNRQFMWPKASWCILGLNLSQLFLRAMYFGPIMRDQTHLLSNCTKQSMNNERTNHNTASCYLESFFFLCIKKPVWQVGHSCVICFKRIHIIVCILTQPVRLSKYNTTSKIIQQ